MAKITKKKRVIVLSKTLAKYGRKRYEEGIIEAMSVAVNMFNCEDRIREGVFRVLKIEY